MPAPVAKADDGGLAAEVMPEGCMGVWSASLPSNAYYLKRAAYKVTLVSTRVTTPEFKGGSRRYIDLNVDEAGDFVQTERSVLVVEPDSAADGAVSTKVEGWEVPQELRAVVQITPQHAAVVVAAVGDHKEVDQDHHSFDLLLRQTLFGGTITVPEEGPGGMVSEVTRRPM